MKNLRISGDDLRTVQLLVRHFHAENSTGEPFSGGTLIVCSHSEESLIPEAMRCSANGTRLIWLAPYPAEMRNELAKIVPEETETRFQLPGNYRDGISETFFPAAFPECRVPVILNRRGELPFETVQTRLEAHRNGTPLRYPSFGGSGKQVFDVLAVSDLLNLLEQEIKETECGGRLLHVSGGMERSLSLLELTSVCESVTGKTTRITNDESMKGIPPVLVGDTRKAEKMYDWHPEKSLEDIVEELSHV